MKTKKINRHRFFNKRKNNEKQMQSQFGNDDGTWTLKKISTYSAPAWFQQGRLFFGFPPISQVMYPGQTFRVQMGWKIQNIPQSAVMQILPSQRLLAAGVLAFPKIINFIDQQNQITQILYNNSKYPIVFSVDLSSPTNGKMYQVQQQQQIFQFPLSQLSQSTLSILNALIPIFV